MNKKSSEAIPASNGLDSLKWGLIVILFAAGFWANYYYAQIDWAYRLIGWIVLTCVMISVALQTGLGRKTWSFAKEARAELYKVYWPTRQETIQTTMIVIGMVMIMALILWGIDSFLLWVVAGLTGRG